MYLVYIGIQYINCKEYCNQNTITININGSIFIRHGKSTMIIILQKKMDLDKRKIKNHPPSPVNNTRVETAFL